MWNIEIISIDTNSGWNIEWHITGMWVEVERWNHMETWYSVFKIWRCRHRLIHELILISRDTVIGEEEYFSFFTFRIPLQHINIYIMDKSFSTMMALFCYIFSFLNLCDTFQHKIYRTSYMQQGFDSNVEMGTSLRSLFIFGIWKNVLL